MRQISLTDDELMLLDGKCRPETQELVEAARQRIAFVAAIPGLPSDHARFVADVVREAQKNGRLSFYYTSIRSCDVCHKQAGYAAHKNSRYNKRGTPNYRKPLTMGGVELAHRGVSIIGYTNLGCCRECLELVRPHVVAALETVRAEIPKGLTGHEPRFRWHQNKKCTACEWRGHDGQLGLLPALMGGSYPGQCPSCGAKNLPFGKDFIKRDEGFTVVA